MIGIVLSAFFGMTVIFCLNFWLAIRTLGDEIKLDFSVEDFVYEMYAGHRYGRDD